MPPKEMELEGTPAEATWAMITVIIVVIVVIIFCCLIPFFKALEKRYHHWEDEENDPRWDQDQFQFSPTSPRLERSASSSNYNRLSVCSGEDSSVTTSTSNINNTFKNHCLLPRFEDQVEFKLPKKYDDGFNKAGDDVIAEEDNNMSQVTTSSATQKSSPVKKFGKIHKKTLEPSPLTLSRVENEIDNKTNSVKTHKNSSSTTQNAAKQAIRESQPSHSKPVAPPKRNSKLMSPAVEDRKTASHGIKPSQISPPSKVSSNGSIKPQPQAAVPSKPVQNGAAEVSPPVRKSYKKVKKTIPDTNAVSS